MRIVGVHGVGNHRPGESPEKAAQNLSGIWAESLAATVAEHVAVAYYADRLQVRGGQGPAGGLAGLDAFEQDLVRAWLNELAPPEAVAAGPGTWPLRQAVGWVARTRSLGRPATEWFVATFFREVATYLRDADGAARRAAREHVAGVVAKERPDVVLAHSLGSVVAYEALWTLPEVPVGLFVTLGSPLALPHAVFPRLRPTPLDGRGTRPPGVRRWVNLADPGDLVAVPPGGVARGFAGVDSDLQATIHAFDFHRVRNYLRSPRLAGVLAEVARG
ncbi:hypothetical protein [Streptomyces sp. NPDC017988]|uniref:hypothetical protein n=1 Tax=Streptomyces sp. NPDC017988 TaxID=3365025 RepID=UPI0037A8C632